MAKKEQIKNPEHYAVASAKNLPFSTKHGIVISDFLRYKTIEQSKKLLEEVVVLKRAVPFKRFYHNMGHKAGMSSGRMPQKAAKFFLLLLKSVEANAHAKGLNSTNLKITRLLANRASVPLTGGRRRVATKRTHLEIEVKEVLKKEKKERKGKAENAGKKKELKVDDAKKEQKKSVVKEELKSKVKELDQDHNKNNDDNNDPGDKKLLKKSSLSKRLKSFILRNIFNLD